MTTAKTRWVVATLGSLVTFVVVMVIGRAADPGWLPKGDAGWGVLAGFAAVAAAAVLAAGGWWAGQAVGGGAAPRRRVRQKAVARGEAEIDQAASHQYPAGSGGRRSAAQQADVVQNAKAGGKARIRQSGGDQYL